MSCLARVLVFVLLAFGFGVAQARDTWDAKRQKLAITAVAGAPRTSLFNPPELDVFLTDASSGLDTGCTFNTDPRNPLTIDVMVDRFVGDVDADGHLLNVAALVSAQILPASVDIIMPAYDVDYAGGPPPERDEVLFNGESLGYLTGENNVWKLNSFRVDIRKIKFPKRPAVGIAPAPVTNRIQIRIDTLSVNTWCTSIDWVAMVVPVRPKLAVDLAVDVSHSVVGRNGATLLKLQEQAFDANCNVQTTLGEPKAEFPFHGAAKSFFGGEGSATLKAQIKTCPESSITPSKVTADWVIEGTSSKGTTPMIGLSGPIEMKMPAVIGDYNVKLDFTIENGQKISASRKLFVTQSAPSVATPKIQYFEKATTWAKGLSDTDRILVAVQQGLFTNGASWRYGYYFGNLKQRCSGDELLLYDPVTRLGCDYGDCYMFSEALETVANTLGIGGFVEIDPTGANGKGFVTTGSPSLDPKWRGNAGLLGSAALTLDHYRFTSHSLKWRWFTYYDATFNARYTKTTEFIYLNLKPQGSARYQETDEGARVYKSAAIPTTDYQAIWGVYGYTAPTLRLAESGPPKAVAALPPLNFLAARSRPIDIDKDGRSEALVVDLDIDLPSPGPYLVSATLTNAAGVEIANRPAFRSMLSVDAIVSGAGRKTISLQFSGEQIRRSNSNGPYTVALVAGSGLVDEAGSANFTTPAYTAQSFGEIKAALQALTATPVDADKSGRYEAVQVEGSFDVAVAGPYEVRVNLHGNGSDLVAVRRLKQLTAGRQTVSITLPGTGIARSGVDGPYQVALGLFDGAGAGVQSQVTEMQNLTATQFEAVVDLVGAPTEQVIDSNGNGLFNLLRISPQLQSRSTRDVIVKARLVGANGASVDIDAAAKLVAGQPLRMAIDFSGPDLRRLQMDSQYTLQLSFRDPATLAEIDTATVLLKGVYMSAKFDSNTSVQAIALSGTVSDRGVDTNGNGKFEQLVVDVGVEIATAGVYEWSARLVDKAGAEIGFVSGRASLASGKSALDLQFDGRLIGKNGVDGPFYVRSLLVAGVNGANLVSAFAGQTSARPASAFEGFVKRLLGDVNGDGVIDQNDVTAFNKALGAGVGEAAYNSAADFDHDGRITLNDLRLFRAYLPRR